MQYKIILLLLAITARLFALQDIKQPTLKYSTEIYLDSTFLDSGIILNTTISDSGKVVDIDCIDSNNFVYRDTLFKQLKKWVFEPAKLGDTTISVLCSLYIPVKKRINKNSIQQKLNKDSKNIDVNSSDSNIIKRDKNQANNLEYTIDVNQFVTKNRGITTFNSEEINKGAGYIHESIKILQLSKSTNTVPSNQWRDGGLLIRGANTFDSKYFLNGVSIDKYYHLGGQTSVMPGDVVANIELFPSMNNSIFNNSSGGAVNLITKDTIIDKRLTVGFNGFDWFGQFQTSFLDNWNLLFFARRMELTDYKFNFENYILKEVDWRFDYSDIHYLDLFSMINYLGKNNRFSLLYSKADDYMDYFTLVPKELYPYKIKLIELDKKIDPYGNGDGLLDQEQIFTQQKYDSLYYALPNKIPSSNYVKYFDSFNHHQQQLIIGNYKQNFHNLLFDNSIKFQKIVFNDSVCEKEVSNSYNKDNFYYGGQFKSNSNSKFNLNMGYRIDLNRVESKLDTLSYFYSTNFHIENDFIKGLDLSNKSFSYYLSTLWASVNIKFSNFNLVPYINYNVYSKDNIQKGKFYDYRVNLLYNNPFNIYVSYGHNNRVDFSVFTNIVKPISVNQYEIGIDKYNIFDDIFISASMYKNDFNNELEVVKTKYVNPTLPTNEIVDGYKILFYNTKKRVYGSEIGALLNLDDFKLRTNLSIINSKTYSHTYNQWLTTPNVSLFNYKITLLHKIFERHTLSLSGVFNSSLVDYENVGNLMDYSVMINQELYFLEPNKEYKDVFASVNFAWLYELKSNSGNHFNCDLSVRDLLSPFFTANDWSNDRYPVIQIRLSYTFDLN